MYVSVEKTSYRAQAMETSGIRTRVLTSSWERVKAGADVRTGRKGSGGGGSVDEPAGSCMSACAANSTCCILLNR